MYFVHATAGESVDVVAAERRRDRPVYAETLHNLLCFSNQDYLKQDGAKYHIGMGLPTPEDRVQLWEGVAAGNIATVATDEYTTRSASRWVATTSRRSRAGTSGSSPAA